MGRAPTIAPVAVLPLLGRMGIAACPRARCLLRAARTGRRRLALAFSHSDVTTRLASGRCRSFSACGRAKFDARPTRLRKADGDRLLARAHVAAALLIFVHFLANEFARLSRRFFSFARITSCALLRLLSRHDVFVGVDGARIHLRRAWRHGAKSASVNRVGGGLSMNLARFRAR